MVPHSPFIVTAMLLIMSGTPTEAAPAELDKLARRFPLESKAGGITHEKAINLVGFRHGCHQHRHGIGSGTDAAAV
jgi:hypothetical protein